MRKQLEKAGLYDVLVHLHEQKHNEEDRFCTTEIAGAYTKLLSLISAHTEAKVREAEEKRLLELKAYWDNLAKQYDLYTTVGHIQSWVDKRLIELAQPPKEES